ncbi:MAG: hypothetical protein ACK2TW_04195 [Anaerolineales bacterium]
MNSYEGDDAVPATVGVEQTGSDVTSSAEPINPDIGYDPEDLEGIAPGALW